jgi:hypothetical protein
MRNKSIFFAILWSFGFIHCKPLSNIPILLQNATQKQPEVEWESIGDRSKSKHALKELYFPYANDGVVIDSSLCIVLPNGKKLGFCSNQQELFLIPKHIRHFFIFSPRFNCYTKVDIYSKYPKILVWIEEYKGEIKFYVSHSNVNFYFG